MRIKKLHIQNFKSLVDFHLEDIPQFCAFVGPNASGKSNIFEALEFLNFVLTYTPKSINSLEERKNLISYNTGLDTITYRIFFKDGINLTYGFRLPENVDDSKLTYVDSTLYSPSSFNFYDPDFRKNNIEKWEKLGVEYENDYEIFFDSFSRIFVGKPELKKINQSSNKLLIDGSNTSQILGKIFQDEAKKEDFTQWLSVLIPEFKSIDVQKSGIDGSFHIFVYEKSHTKPFPITLLSDGTKNILALMAAVYQSNEPQFLCIEEPENGLHPHAIETLVDFFREKCETEGHHIWLNTHSPTLIRCLEIEEVITVNKINGETKAKTFKKEEDFGIKMDEAWLTNALGGGVSWSK